MLAAWLLILSGTLATTYGYQESFCNGPCVKGNLTTNSELFNPSFPTAAAAIPSKYRIRGQWIGLRTETGKCQKIWLNDRMSGWTKGERGFDLSPAAVKVLGGKPSKYWSGKVFLCHTQGFGSMVRYTQQKEGEI